MKKNRPNIIVYIRSTYALNSNRWNGLKSNHIPNIFYCFVRQMTREFRFNQNTYEKNNNNKQLSQFAHET